MTCGGGSWPAEGPAAHPAAAGLPSGPGGAVEFELGVGSSGHRLGDHRAEAVVEGVLRGPGFQVVSQAGEQAEVSGRAGLEGEGQRREEEDRGECGEGREALAGVAGHRGRADRKGIVPLSTLDRGTGAMDFKGLAVDVRGC